MRIKRVFSVVQGVQNLVFLPAAGLADERARQTLRMIISLVSFHLVLVSLTALQFWLENRLELPIIIQLLLQIVILALIYTRYTKKAVSFFVITYVASNFLGVMFLSLTNLLYVLTAFVAVTILLEGWQRLVHGAVVFAAVLIAGYLTADHPQYAVINHDNAVMFVALGIISVLISTSVVEGNLRLIRAQVGLLHQQRDELDRFFTSALDLLCIADIDGYFKKVNLEWEKVLGYPHREIEGGRYLDFVHPDDLPATHDAIMKLRQGSPILNFTNRYRCKDGSYRLIEWRSYPYGQLIYAAARDITDQHATKVKLRESEALLAEAEHIAKLGSWRWDTASDHITWSDELYNIFGVEKEYPLHHYASYLELIHPEDRQHVDANIHAAVVSHQDYQFFHRVMHPQHGERIIDARGNVAKDAEGNVLYLYGTAQDVTDFKQTEAALIQSHQLWDALLNALPDLVIRCNIEGEIIEIKGNRSNIPLPAEAYLGQSIYHLVRIAVKYGVDVDAGFFDKIVEMLRNAITLGDMQTFEYAVRSPEQGQQHFEIRLVATSGKDILGIVRNTTQAVKHRHEQERLTAKLQAVNSELQNFAYVISHDLKAPLRGISSVSMWFEQDYGDRLDAEGRALLVLLNNRAQRMEAMIEGVLEYSRIGSEEYFSSVELDTMLHDIADEVTTETNCTVTFQTPLPRIAANPTRIRQVFQNLIENAVKYMDKPVGLIQVDCQRKDDMWMFSISDNGPGIDEQHFERIFQLFQVLNPRDDIASTGIGLTIVKRILESYGGRIWLRSALGEGTTFCFTLPAVNWEA
jgi:PAS domain S-box-containing protein